MIKDVDIVEQCETLRGLVVHKRPAQYRPDMLEDVVPIPGQNDLYCTMNGEPSLPAYRRVSDNWQVRQPLELLEAMGFNDFSEAWGFRHSRTELQYENSRESVTGVQLLFSADLEERYTKNLGKHSINFSLSLSWNGCHADKIRVWLVDRWCSNGQLGRQGLYCVGVNHAKNLTDYVDKAEIFSRIEEHLKWKNSLEDVKLNYPLEAEVVKLLEHNNTALHDHLQKESASPGTRAEPNGYLHGVIRDLCHTDQAWRKPWDNHPTLSKAMRIISFCPVKRRAYGQPAVSRRRLNQVSEAVQQEAARETWRGDTMLDLSNVLTRIYCQEAAQMPKKIEEQFNQLLKSLN